MTERHWQPSERRRPSRRSLLAGLGTAALTGVAGCFGGEGQTGPETSAGTRGTAAQSGSGTLPTPVQGNPDADVTVLVFEDFACPHCRDYSLNVQPRIESEYADPGDIRYEFHDFPIPVDEEVSWAAACAARAVQAAEGDAAFFEYAHALFENQRDLGPATYERLATDQGLDGAAIREAAVQRQYESTVRADRQYGQQIGVRGTPTVVVGQRAVRPTYDAISSAIDEQLGSTA